MSQNDPEVLRAEIARTRAELSDNVDTLADTANPKNIANRQFGGAGTSPGPAETAWVAGYDPRQPHP